MSPYQAIYSLTIPNVFFLKEALAFYIKITGLHGLQVQDQSFFVVKLRHTFIFIIYKPVNHWKQGCQVQIY